MGKNQIVKVRCFTIARIKQDLPAMLRSKHCVFKFHGVLHITYLAIFECLMPSAYSVGFPDHAMADRYALQLRRHGYNCARFHFLDANFLDRVT